MCMDGIKGYSVPTRSETVHQSPLTCFMHILFFHSVCVSVIKLK